MPNIFKKSTKPAATVNQKRKRISSNYGNIILRKNLERVQQLPVQITTAPVVDSEGDVNMTESSSSNVVPVECNLDVWIQDDDFEDELRKNFSVPYDFDLEEDDVELFVESADVEGDYFAGVEGRAIST